MIWKDTNDDKWQKAHVTMKELNDNIDHMKVVIIN